jgi:hypothetical protein
MKKLAAVAMLPILSGLLGAGCGGGSANPLAADAPDARVQHLSSDGIVRTQSANRALQMQTGPVIIHSGGFSLPASYGAMGDFAVPGPGTLTVTTTWTGASTVAVTATSTNCNDIVRAFAVDCENMMDSPSSDTSPLVATFSVPAGGHARLWVGNAGTSTVSGTVSVVFTPPVVGGDVILTGTFTDILPGYAKFGDVTVPGRGDVTITVNRSGTNVLHVAVTPAACLDATAAITGACGNVVGVDRGRDAPKTLSFAVAERTDLKVWVGNAGSTNESGTVEVRFVPAR